MMSKNKKAMLPTLPSKTNLNTKFTMNNITPKQNKFQYDCSFCLRELPSGGHRFDGFGACPRCFKLAHLFVDALRGHRANYLNNLGVRK
jgi:hypothetical protein